MKKSLKVLALAGFLLSALAGFALARHLFLASGHGSISVAYENEEVRQMVDFGVDRNRDGVVDEWSSGFYGDETPLLIGDFTLTEQRPLDAFPLYVRSNVENTYKLSAVLGKSNDAKPEYVKVKVIQIFSTGQGVGVGNLFEGTLKEFAESETDPFTIGGNHDDIAEIHISFEAEYPEGYNGDEGDVENVDYNPFHIVIKEAE